MAPHIVKAYDDELTHLSGLIRQMGELTLKQIEAAAKAVKERNTPLAQTIIKQDQAINDIELLVDKQAVRILALRQPVARDLRLVVAALKISNQIERIADYASNIAKRAIRLESIPAFIDESPLDAMFVQTQKMILQVLDAFQSFDDSMALEVWNMDLEVDDVYNGYLKRILEHMALYPDHIEPCTHLLFVAKNIERIGDQATNVAESVHYMVTGELFKEKH